MSDETIKAQTLAYLDTHGDPHPEASHIETARRLLEQGAIDPNGRSDPAGTAARYIGEWRADESMRGRGSRKIKSRPTATTNSIAT